MAAAAARIITYAASASYVWLFALVGCVAAAMLPVMLLILFRKDTRKRGAGALNILTCRFLAAAVANVVYWNMFMFWEI